MRALKVFTRTATTAYQSIMLTAIKQCAGEHRAKRPLSPPSRIHRVSNVRSRADQSEKVTAGRLCPISGVCAGPDPGGSAGRLHGRPDGRFQRPLVGEPRSTALGARWSGHRMPRRTARLCVADPNTEFSLMALPRPGARVDLDARRLIHWIRFGTTPCGP